jgi:hypothetical protein
VSQYSSKRAEHTGSKMVGLGGAKRWTVISG